MKIAVTGGTGFVGSVMVKRLLDDGHQVTVVARRTQAGVREGLSFVKGDVISGLGLKEAFAGKDAVIHLVGIIREVGVNTFESVHRKGTDNVVRWAQQAGVNRYLHMSALGTRQGAVSAYHRSKLAGELIVRSSRLQWTIFRPSIIFGPGDSFINMLAAVLRKTPVMPLIGGGKSRMQPVFVEDVAAAFAAALGKKGSVGKIYELGGPEVLTLKQILNIIAKVTGIKRVYLPIPFGVVGIFSRLASAVGVTAPVTPDQLQMIREDNVVRGGEDASQLGVSFTDLEQVLQRYLTVAD